MESSEEEEESERFHLSWFLSIAYDPVKTTLSELEAEVEEPTNEKARNWVLWLVYSSAPASDFNNLVFTSV